MLGRSGNKQMGPEGWGRAFWYQADREMHEMEDLREVAKEPLSSILSSR
jgi:hypothetical protein